MCNYNHESHKAINQWNGSFANLPQQLGKDAYRQLVKSVRTGRSQPGCDLMNGRPLPPSFIEQGHYLYPKNFDFILNKMKRQPNRCQWCGQQLPSSFTHQHSQPHDHREEIQHHFHANCWQARLLALAIVFGHLSPHIIFPSRPTGGKSRRWKVRETVEYVVKNVWRVRKSRTGRRW